MGMKHKLFLHDRPIIGIDVSPTYIKLMAIDTKHWRVTSYGSVSVDPQKLQDSFNTEINSYISDLIQELVKNNVVGRISTTFAAVSIPTNRTYSRSINLPIAALKKLDEAVQLEAEQYIPVPLADLNVSYEIINKDKKTVDVLMSAAPRKIVDKVVAACADAGFTTVMVEPSISSVARLITMTEEGHLPTVIVDIGAANTDIAVLDKKIRATGGIQVGGNTFTVDISKKLEVSLENAHQLKVLNGLGVGPKQTKIKAALKPSLDQIITEIKKIIRYYNERIEAEQKIEQIIIVGGGSNIPGLGDYFTESLVMPVRVANPWQIFNFGKLAQPSKQFKPRYITVAGLASISHKELWK